MWRADRAGDQNGSGSAECNFGKKTNASSEQVIIGIDNGLDGGLCAISNHGAVIVYCAMPTYHRKGKREIDVKAAYQWISNLHSPCVLVIEEPLKHARSSQAMRSMAMSFGKLLAMAEMKDLPTASVDVHEWQKKLLGRVPKGKTKKVAFELAHQLQPDEKWLATKKSKVPHDGIIDAFLIARHYLNQQNDNKRKGSHTFETKKNHSTRTDNRRKTVEG